MKRFRNWLLEAVKGPRVGVLIASVWLVCLIFPVHSLLALEDRVRCLVVSETWGASSTRLAGAGSCCGAVSCWR